MAKLKMRDLKRDEKGYLMVEIEEPSLVLNADGSGDKKDESVAEKAEEVIKKTKNNIGVWIAGTLITITAITIVVSLSNKNK